MKKILLIIAIVNYCNASFSQKKVTYTKDEIIAKSIKSVDTYLLKYFDSATYRKYYKINNEFSKIEFTLAFNDLNSNTILKSSINNIKISVKFKTTIYEDGIELDLNNNFIVKENISYGKETKNLTEIFINSQLNFIKTIEEKKVLSPTKVYDFVKSKSPEKEWTTPKISRSSFPPYAFHYKVMENSCSTCSIYYIDLKELIEIGKSKAEAIAF